MSVQTLTLDGKQYAVLEAKEYQRLRELAGAAASGFPPLPVPDEAGRFPAVGYARASLARKIVRERRTVGLSQAELARRARIRPETLNRIERGRSTPGVATVEKIVRAIEAAHSDVSE
ncbi:helix-turn-helix transcriptional regulator [bacterium]|nr:helix-turn-helix transcriptional regulator [bacterium]